MTQPSGALCAVYCDGVPCRAVGDDRRYVPSWCFISTGFGFLLGTSTPAKVVVILGAPTSLGENPTKTQGTASSLLGGWCGSTQGTASPPLRVTGNGVVVTGVIGAEGVEPTMLGMALA